jgi:type II secretory pathway component GspD/PulD (secretin)
VELSDASQLGRPGVRLVLIPRVGQQPGPTRVVATLAQPGRTIAARAELPVETAATRRSAFLAQAGDDLWTVLGQRLLAGPPSLAAIARLDDLTAALTGEWAAPPPAKEAKAAGQKIAAKAAEQGVQLTDEQIQRAVLDSIRALMINYETRVIAVQSDWFEQIGVDLDVYLNTNDNMWNAARAADPNFNISDFFNADGTNQGAVVFGPIGSTGGTGPANTDATGAAFGVPTDDGTDIQYVYGPVGTPVRRQQGWNPVGFNQDSVGVIGALDGAVSGIGADILGAGAAAATTGFSYMDDIQVDLLIKATQADQRTVVLTAPRLTLMNGQRSWISIETGTTYIANAIPVVGDASTSFQLIPDVASSGFVLDIEGVISADRRYVTMTVSYDQSKLLDFGETDVTGAVGGTGTTGGRGANSSATIQLPVFQTQRIRTTVSVPDKGTILLGGQRTFNEVEIESGVPILSKIPIVNRFFTNRLDSEQELTTIILLRPEIVIQSENEDLLFPGLVDQLGNLGG